MNSRRTFLKQISGAALAASVLPQYTLRSAASQTGNLDIPGEDGMIVRSFRFVDLETPVEYLNTWLTPVPHFFVRNHMHEPSQVDASSWRLSVGGEVERPLTLTLAELSSWEGIQSSTRWNAPAMDAACTTRRFPGFSGARVR